MKLWIPVKKKIHCNKTEWAPVLPTSPSQAIGHAYCRRTVSGNVFNRILLAGLNVLFSCVEQHNGFFIVELLSTAWLLQLCNNYQHYSDVVALLLVVILVTELTALLRPMKPIWMPNQTESGMNTNFEFSLKSLRNFKFFFESTINDHNTLLCLVFDMKRSFQQHRR